MKPSAGQSGLPRLPSSSTAPPGSSSLPLPRAASASKAAATFTTSAFPAAFGMTPRLPTLDPRLDGSPSFAAALAFDDIRDEPFDEARGEGGGEGGFTSMFRAPGTRSSRNPR